MKNITAKRNAGKVNGESGFSLLELLVSMIIFLIVSGSIWGLLRTAQQSRSAVTEQVQLAKNVRIALNLISRDAFNAGYGYPATSTVLLPDNRISTRLGIPNDSNATRDTVPPVIAGNNLITSTFNTVANTRMDQVTFLYKDPNFNLVGVIGPPDRRASQPLTINSRLTTAGGIVELSSLSGNGSCQVNDIFLLTGATGSTIGLVTGLAGTNSVQFANGDLLGFNETALAGVLNNIGASTMYKINMVTYFVTADGILTRREFANVLPAVISVDEPLVYNVENFQIKYVMDSGALVDNPFDGPDGLPSTSDDTLANLAAVRQIRFTVSVRSTEKNSAGQLYKETMTTTVSTRNLGYDAS